MESLSKLISMYDREVERLEVLSVKLNHHPARGFRFSLIDGVAIAVCAAATYFSFPALGSVVWMFPFVLGHFFLFCNVFRIHRNLELIWAGCFVLNYCVCAILEIDWRLVFAFQIPITTLLIAIEIRSPRYHGIFSGKPMDED